MSNHVLVHTGRKSRRQPRPAPRLASGAAALCLGLAATASAQVASVNGQIAFNTCDFHSEVSATTCDIWVMNPDGTGQTNLTNTPAVSEEGPVWSFDGTRIAFIAGTSGVNRLMVMNADGTGLTTITPEPSFQFSPTWSPAGNEIALVRQVPGQVISLQFDVVVVAVDGSGERNLTSSDFDELDPAWSPDGTKIAFAGVRPETTLDPITGEPTPAAQWEIVTVNPDGTGEQVLTAGDPGTPRADHLEEDRAPSWSPDATKLAFMSQSVDPCCTSWQLWAVNRDGTGVSNLTNDETVNDTGPSWSPDGTLILFARSNGLGADLYTIPAPATLPPPVALAAARAVPRAAATAAQLTALGNVSDPDWARKPGTPPPPPPPPPTTNPLFVFVHTARLGVVTSVPDGIRCAPDCFERMPAGTVVTLTATPNRGARFLRWSGACRGTAPSCRVTMKGPKIVGATFRRVR